MFIRVYTVILLNGTIGTNEKKTMNNYEQL